MILQMFFNRFLAVNYQLRIFFYVYDILIFNNFNNRGNITKLSTLSKRWI